MHRITRTSMRGAGVTAFPRLLCFAFTDAHVQQSLPKSPQRREQAARRDDPRRAAPRTGTTPITDESWRLQIRGASAPHRLVVRQNYNRSEWSGDSEIVRDDRPIGPRPSPSAGQDADQERARCRGVRRATRTHLLEQRRREHDVPSEIPVALALSTWSTIRWLSTSPIRRCRASLTRSGSSMASGPKLYSMLARASTGRRLFRISLLRQFLNTDRLCCTRIQSVDVS